MKTTIQTLALLLIIASGILSCNESDTPILSTTQVNFSFNHMVDSAEVEFDTIKYVNAFGNSYSVATLKYFISDIRFHRSDGSYYYFDMEHYVDGQDPNTMLYNSNVLIPAGQYDEVTFIFGLDSVKNVPGLFPDPPENAMEWPPALGQGYHYMKLEGKYDSAALVKNYQAHSGPSKGNQYFIEVSLPNSVFTTKENITTVHINMNINKWWVDPHTIDLNIMTMVMGNQEIQKTLQDNGANVFSFGGID